jgi:hypothetical protein
MNPQNDTPLQAELRAKLLWTIEEWSRRHNDWQTNRHAVHSLISMIARSGPVNAVKGCLRTEGAIDVVLGQLRAHDEDLMVETTMMEERFYELFTDDDREIARWNVATAERLRSNP